MGFDWRTRCQGFLTDREQRRVCGVGILYVLGFPILILMTVVGALKATAPGEHNPNCPAEPNMPWFLVTGGVGITIMLLVRIALNNLLMCVRSKMTCCAEVAGCCCEFSCNLLYDMIVMVFIIMWMITVTWWVFRHKIGPDKLQTMLGKDVLDSFRASLGDNDTIHDVSKSLYRIGFHSLYLKLLMILIFLDLLFFSHFADPNFQSSEIPFFRFSLPTLNMTPIVTVFSSWYPLFS